MTPDSNPEISALRKQIFVLLVALVVVTGTFTVYLYRQASVEGKQIAAIRPQAQQIVSVYNQLQPQLIKFANDLEVYGQTHPDFAQQVLKKDGIVPAK